MADSSRADIEREIRKAIEVQGEKELKAKGREFATEVMEVAKMLSPFDPDDDNVQHYKDSFKIRAKNGRGKLPSWTLSNSDRLATIVEVGSHFRPQGGSSEPQMVFTLTAAHYGGTPDGIGGADDEI